MADNQPSPDYSRPQFPAHNEPRVWVITAGDSPIGISVTRKILMHGDYALVGLAHSSLDRDQCRRDMFDAFLAEIESNEGWAERFKALPLDIRMVGECQALVAQAVAAFGRVDILLCCSSQALIGTVEELSASQQTLNLVRDQFESNYFGPLNIIKATLPHMRKQKSGHIMILSGITAHIGTPGLGMYCAAGWALEGFCDSLAYEIAPFNVKLTIFQCSIEIGILTNLVTSVPPISHVYSSAVNHAPLFREILNRLVSRLSADSSNGANQAGSVEDGPFSASEVISTYPPLSSAHMEVLVSETVYAITAIAGHENPPSRHIVGQEGVASVKEKLKTVSEELEDFIQASFAVDYTADEYSRPSREDGISLGMGAGHDRF
ncbi:short chain dehydrogenase/reductase family protein [Aspergillus sclerotioniger CBS 115572]|uniref:Short chain dehydrogenase/reductase family protein n=1 Tax=Aspergillus sclerotioniger CBS 115572 TaxID=1450535 RepID=A0A317W319_9EURO|nr:short chain dehydrogenase/reductase family protein [Aspergillus sclerotioniger CBS 115572]PWY80944.1 short chain dehydrogenase/reductase family protein [Aspergillus sclerotioniger CBS 115572]